MQETLEDARKQFERARQFICYEDVGKHRTNTVSHEIRDENIQSLSGFMKNGLILVL